MISFFALTGELGLYSFWWPAHFRILSIGLQGFNGANTRTVPSWLISSSWSETAPCHRAMPIR